MRNNQSSTEKKIFIDVCGDEDKFIVKVPLKKREREEIENPNRKPDGSLIHPEGSRYIGQVDADGYYSGLGEMTYLNGSVYLGNFLHGYYHGEGTLTYKDGSFYIGQFVNGLRQGVGILEKPGDYKYSGEFFADSCHGHGTLILESGLTYSGAIFNSKRHGLTTVTFPDGLVLTSYFRENGIVWGPMEFNFPDGTVFSGVPNSFQDLEEIRKAISFSHRAKTARKEEITKPKVDFNHKFQAVFQDNKLIVTDVSNGKKRSL